MQIQGSELQQFIDEGWPGEDYYWDTDMLEDTPDGKALPDIQYDTDDFGRLLWQGHGPDPTSGAGLDLAKVIKVWRKSRTSRILRIRVPNHISNKEIGDALKGIRGKLEK